MQFPLKLLCYARLSLLLHLHVPQIWDRFLCSCPCVLSARIRISSIDPIHLLVTLEYAGTVKRHNVCQLHISIYTGFKQTERTIFLHVINGTKIATALKCIFKKTMPKLSVNFGNHTSQDSHKNQYASPVCDFDFIEPQYSDKC